MVKIRLPLEILPNHHRQIKKRYRVEQHEHPIAVDGGMLREEHQEADNQSGNALCAENQDIPTPVDLLVPYLQIGDSQSNGIEDPGADNG